MPINSDDGLKEVGRIILTNHQGIFQDDDERRPMLLLNYGLLTVGPTEDNSISIFIPEPLFLPINKNGSKSDYRLTRLIDNEPCGKFGLPLDADSVDYMGVIKTPHHVYENMERGVYAIDGITKDEKKKMILTPEQFDKWYEKAGESFIKFASTIARDRHLRYLQELTLETIQFIIKKDNHFFEIYLSVPVLANGVLWKPMMD